MIKICVLLALLVSVFQVALSKATSARTEDDNQHEPQVGSASRISIPRAGLEKLANLTQESNLWILIPSNVSDSQLHESDFSLFKLNTDALLGEIGATGISSSDNGNTDWMRADGPVLGTPESSETSGSGGRLRAGRKLNFFKNVLGKPQVSPLYLVNGTVCRFVNSQPICTTLSTTGLFRGQNPSFLQQQQNGFLNQGNNQQLLPVNQQQANQRQVSPPQQQQFQQQPQLMQNNQFRPSAILDDEQQAVNLTSRSQQAPRPALASPRPVAYAVRRPLTLLSFGRPFRSG